MASSHACWRRFDRRTRLRQARDAGYGPSLGLRRHPTMNESTARFAGWFAHRAGQHLGFILRLGFAAGRQSSQQDSKQVSVFNTEEKREDDRDTEKQGFWRFAQECGHAPREAPKLGLP